MDTVGPQQPICLGSFGPPSTYRRKLVAGSLPRKAHRGPELPHPQWSVRPLSSACLSASVIHIDLPLLPSLSRSSFPALGLLRHLFCLPTQQQSVFALPRAAELLIPGGTLSTDALCLWAFFLTPSQCWFLLCLPNCASSLLDVPSRFSPLWGVCMHVCVPMCVSFLPSPACTHAHTHTQSLSLCGLDRSQASPNSKGTAWLPAGRPSGVWPGAGALSAASVAAWSSQC